MTYIVLTEIFFNTIKCLFLYCCETNCFLLCYKKIKYKDKSVNSKHKIKLIKVVNVIENYNFSLYLRLVWGRIDSVQLSVKRETNKSSFSLKYYQKY